MKQENRWIRYAAGVVGLIFASYMLDQLDDVLVNTVIQAVVRMIRSVLHISLLIGWCISLQKRIINVQVRRSLVAISGFMAFWLIVKVIKYEFIADRMFWLGRYIWYSYYIPMILIPLFGVFIIDHMGNPAEYKNPKWMKVLYIPAFTILIGIFTNDLHQLCFDFPQGIELFDYTYGYGPVYFVAMAWFVLLGIYFVIMLLKKSRVPGSKRMQKLPAVIMGGAVVFWTLYCFGIFREADLIVVDCLIVALLLESAIQSGLFPSNTNYDRLFETSTIAAQIVNKEYQPCFSSSSAMSLTTEEIKHIQETPVKKAGMILQAKAVRAGYVVWQDDVSELDKMMTCLQDVQNQLDRENELLKAELKLKEQQARLEEKGRLFDRITEEIIPQLKRMESLLEQGSDPDQVNAAMAKMCVIGAYVKRRCNLLLLGEERQNISARELEYCIRESLDNVRLASVATLLDARCEGELKVEHIVAAYDFYEEVVEKLIDSITAMMVHLSSKQGTLAMKLQIGFTTDMAENMLNDLSVRLGNVICAVQDEDIIIDYAISEGGEYSEKL